MNPPNVGPEVLLVIAETYKQEVKWEHFQFLQLLKPLPASHPAWVAVARLAVATQHSPDRRTAIRDDVLTETWTSPLESLLGCFLWRPTDARWDRLVEFFATVYIAGLL